MRSNCPKLPSSCLLGAPPCPLASRPPGDARATGGPRGRWRWLGRLLRSSVLVFPVTYDDRARWRGLLHTFVKVAKKNPGDGELVPNFKIAESGPKEEKHRAGVEAPDSESDRHRAGLAGGKVKSKKRLEGSRPPAKRSTQTCAPRSVAERPATACPPRRAASGRSVECPEGPRVNSLFHLSTPF